MYVDKTRDEARDAGALLGTALDELTELARDVHKAVAGRIFTLLGKPARPVRLIHDGIATIAYTSTRVGVRALLAVAGAAAAELRAPSVESLHASPRGHVVLGALNGFWGDRLAEQRASLAPPMSMRTHDGVLRRLPGNVAHDIGADATERIVVFLHGLCENERFWWIGAQKHYGDRGISYGSKLRDEQGWTPLYLSYNTGLHVSANGRELAEQLDALISAWPLPVREIALVGHSMGGLIARSAGHQGERLGHSWVSALRHVVGLGAPHLGAPLERFVNAGTHTLAKLPETRPFATWLNRRSVGIKDLRYGAVLDDDWFGFDPDERLTDHCTEATLLPGVAYSVAAATLSRKPSGPFAHDLLVQHGSAHGIGPKRRIPFEADRSFHVGRKHHFDLLGDPVVYERLRAWLSGADGAAPAARVGVTD